MKRLFTSALLLASVCLISLAASDRLTIDNLSYYHYTGSHATVIRASKSAVVEKLEPLSEVTINNVTYPVAYIGNNGSSTTEPSSFGEALESAILPPSIEVITGYSFQGCKNLKNLYLPDALTTIQGYAFDKCSSLTELTLPANVSSIGRTYVGKAWPAFSGMTSLKRYVSFGSAPLDDQVGINTDVDIYVIPGVSISSKYKNVAKYIFSKEITPMIGGAKLDIKMNYDEFRLLSVTVDGKEIEKDDNGLFMARSLSPETEYNFVANIEYQGRVYSVSLPFKTLTPTVELRFSKTQTTVTGTAYVKEDESCKPDVIRVVFVGTECSLDENNSFTYKGLMPDTEYNYSVQAWYGDKVFYKNDKVKTLAVTSSMKSEVTPTSIRLTPSCNYGDTEYVEDKLMILENKQYVDLTSEFLTGLDPETTYTFKHIIVVKVAPSQLNYQYPTVYNIKTSKLTLETQDAVATSTTSARLKAFTNATDETGFGFEWRRIDSPDLIPSTYVDSPLVDGALVGSLRNVNPDVYYKYRPYYQSASDKMYYGEWSGIFTGDANIYYEPELTTLEPKISNDKTYIAEGFVIDGTDEIIEQGFEYYISSAFGAISAKASGEAKRVKASGMHMMAALNDLMPDTDYIIRTYAITSRGTTYGNEVSFNTEDPSGVEGIIEDEATEIYVLGYYDINGVRKDIPHCGFNIILYSDGSTRKVVLNNLR